MVGKIRLVPLLMLSIMATIQDAPALAQTRITVGVAAMSPRTIPLLIAQEQGIFGKQGIEARIVLIKGAPTLVASLISGDIEVGYTGGTAVIGAVASGSDLKVLSALTNRVTYDLVVRPGIKTPEDLRNKKFGVQSIGGTVWMGAMLALEHLGLDPDRDKISIIAAGDQTVLAQAVATGTIDATVLDGVQSRPLHAKGFPILAELGNAKLPILSSSLVAREPYIQKNPQIVENVMRAVIEGAAFCLSPREKPNTLKILQKYLRISEKDAEEGYKDMVTGLDRKPYANPAGVTNVIRLMKRSNPKVENVKPEALIDDRILKKIDQSGFIDEVMAKYGVK